MIGEPPGELQEVLQEAMGASWRAAVRAGTNQVAKRPCRRHTVPEREVEGRASLGDKVVLQLSYDKPEAANLDRVWMCLDTSQRPCVFLYQNASTRIWIQVWV